MSTSVADMQEFQPYHAHYWLSPTSNFQQSGLVVQRKCDRGVLVLRSLTLRLIRPGESVVLATATSQEELWGLLQKEFLMVPDQWPESQRSELWERCHRYHLAWLAGKQAPAGGED